MKPASFAYAKARSADHAIELLAGADGDAHVLAGGQSLLAGLNMRLSAPALLVDINGIEELCDISLENGEVRIGALVRHAEAERSPVIAQHAPLFAMALPQIAHPAIRNRGTIGGSIAFADPAAELPACLLALDGAVDIAGPGGRRTIKAGDFFEDLYQTALGEQDILTGVRIPMASGETRTGFAELARRHGDYAMVGLAACARAKEGELADLRLVFFGVDLVPLRAAGAEGALMGIEIDGSRIEAAVAMLDQDLDPPDDVQADGATKKYLAGVLLRRVTRQLLENAP